MLFTFSSHIWIDFHWTNIQIWMDRDPAMTGYPSTSVKIFNERKLVLGPLDVKVKVKVKPKKLRNSMILSELLDDLCLWQVCNVCKYASIQVCNYASMQVNRYASMQVLKYASIQVCKFASTQVCR